MSEPLRHLFVTGFARSGTSLLAHLLDAQPRFTVRGEMLAAPLGIAAEAGGFRRMLEPPLRRRALAWHKQSLSTHGVETRIGLDDFATAGDLYRLALDELARPDDVVVGHKLTGYGPHTQVFDALLAETDVRCVCVLRDVRDVALSQASWLTGSVLDPDTWTTFARKLRTLEGHPRVVVVRYETLVEAPDRALAPVAALLGAPIRSDVALQTEQARPWRDNSSFHDVARTPDPRPIARWRDAHEDPHVRFAAWACADELARWGYPAFDAPFSRRERLRYRRARAVRTLSRRVRPLVEIARRLRAP